MQEKICLYVQMLHAHKVAAPSIQLGMLEWNCLDSARFHQRMGLTKVSVAIKFLLLLTAFQSGGTGRPNLVALGC